MCGGATLAPARASAGCTIDRKNQAMPKSTFLHQFKLKLRQCNCGRELYIGPNIFLPYWALNTPCILGLLFYGMKLYSIGHNSIISCTSISRKQYTIMLPHKASSDMIRIVLLTYTGRSTVSQQRLHSLIWIGTSASKLHLYPDLPPQASPPCCSATSRVHLHVVGTSKLRLYVVLAPPRPN